MTTAPVLVRIAMMMYALIALIIMAIAGSSSATFGHAVKVRLNTDLLRRLDRIEAYARSRNRRDVTRSSILRDAIAAYVAPLISLLDENKEPDRTTGDNPFASQPRGDGSAGQAVRVRLDARLLHVLDRVEAYARGLNYRHVTRSWLIREAITAYLEGFDRELPLNDTKEASDITMGRKPPSSEVGTETKIRRQA